MAKIKKPNPKQTKDHDQKIVEINPILEIQKEHKDWYNRNTMGKMRGRPTLLPHEVKKQKGTAKHSLRKEK